jgi:hypothetical protein
VVWLVEFFGEAKSFKVAGSHAVSVVWVKGYRFDDSDALRIIHGGQPPVPQCGIGSTGSW